MRQTTTQPVASPWPHRLALLLACVTFPMVCVGAMVTTTHAGMAVPDWPTTFGYWPFSYPLSTWLWAPWNLFIEHGHRLLGWFVVGPVTIALLIVLWKREGRRWVRYFGLFALALVLLQGFLGGLRVVLDDLELAKIHGCVGPLFFATAVSLAVFTSRWWRDGPPARLDGGSGRLHRLTLLTTLLVYAQIVAGAQLRHVAADVPPQTFSAMVGVHLLLAAAVAVHAGLLLFGVWRHHRSSRALMRLAIVLCVLVASQLALGAATWALKFGWPAGLLGPRPRLAEWTITAGSMEQSVITTAHVAMGSLILATALTLSLYSFRLLQRPRDSAMLERTAWGVAR